MPTGILENIIIAPPFYTERRALLAASTKDMMDGSTKSSSIAFETSATGIP
jgi:hypothetical protein